jgi:hypothetical protein
MGNIGTRRALLAGGIRPVYFENFLAESALSGNMAFSRASGATMFNASGTLVSVGANVPRFDTNPSTLAPAGLLIEGASTNYVQNNSPAGSGFPSNWGVRTTGGLALQTVGTGTEDGIPYVDIRFYGTTTNSQGPCLQFMMGVSAEQGQTWTSSLYLKNVGGSLSNISALQIYTEEDPYSNGSGVFSSNIVPTGAALSTQRFSLTNTLVHSTTTSVFSALWAQIGTGLAVDFTLRYGAPQFEQMAYATSPILTTSGAVTRGADAAAFVNEPAGSIIVEWSYEATGAISRSLFSAGAFGPSFTTGKRYREIAAYAPGTPAAHLNSRLTAR